MKTEDREQQFARILASTLRLARQQGNTLTEAQITEAFRELALDKRQTDAVKTYFKEHRILIGETSGKPEKKGKKQYEAALDDDTLEAVFAECLAGDRNARTRLIEAYLPMVEDVSRLYLEQGVLREDLIGEGNVALVAGAEYLGAYETVREAEEGLFQCVMGAMEALVRRTMQEKADDEKTLALVRDVAEKTAQLAQEYRRDITIAELVDETDWTHAEITEVLRLVGNDLDGLRLTEEDLFTGEGV